VVQVAVREEAAELERHCEGAGPALRRGGPSGGARVLGGRGHGRRGKGRAVAVNRRKKTEFSPYLKSMSKRTIFQRCKSRYVHVHAAKVYHALRDIFFHWRR
jgi:hypothetical protein